MSITVQKHEADEYNISIKTPKLVIENIVDEDHLIQLVSQAKACLGDRPEHVEPKTQIKSRHQISIVNFKRHEFVSPKDTWAHESDRNTTAWWVDNDLVAWCQLIRDKIGEQIVITSGYRSPEYNDTIPGAKKNSQHILGRAVDIACDPIKKAKILQVVGEINSDIENKRLDLKPIRGIGPAYEDFVHLDIRKSDVIHYW